MTIGSAGFGLACLCLLAFTAIVAPGTAAAAETCPNAKYRTGPSLALPECRAYEMVTPPGKTNLLKLRTAGANIAKFTEDGEGILYMVASGPLAEVAAAGMPTWERARRTATGWKAESATPPILAPYGETVNSYPRWVIPSANLDKIFFTASAVFDPDQTFTNAAFNGSVHLSDGHTDTWVSRPTWAGAAPAQGTKDAGWTRFMPLGGSPDLSTVYFNSYATLTPEDALSGRNALESMAVYKYENGHLSNAGVLPDGTLSPGGSISPDRVGQEVASGPSANDSDATLDNPVSRDGKSLLFLSPDPVRAAADPSLPKPQLYMATEGQKSVLISAPEGSDKPAAGTTGVEPTSDRMGTANDFTSGYAVATPDHSVVLFSTKDALTSTAAAVSPEVVKTYRYDTRDGSLTYLPDLNRTVGVTLGDQKYGYVVELSESGASMLYLTAGGSLRLWREGKPTLTVSEEVDPKLAAANTYIANARFSDDESVVVLTSTGPLRGDPDHTPGSIPSTFRSQVYRYTVADDGLDCISCKPGGSLTGASTSAWGPQNSIAGSTLTPNGNWSNRSMTADGSTIYFTTATPLVEDDHNNVEDVYQWHDGKLKLISTGATGADASVLYGTTRDGRDVFIVSDSRLSPADTDDMYDIYDVRVGGGFDLPVPPQLCSGDGCQGPPAPVSAAPPVGSATVDGHGNAKADARVSLRVSMPKAVKGTSVGVRVRVAVPGRIIVNGHLVKKRTRAASKAGTYRIRVTLAKAGKKRLKKGSKLSTRLRVRFEPTVGRLATRQARVVFKQRGAKHSPSAHGRKGR